MPIRKWEKPGKWYTYSSTPEGREKVNRRKREEILFPRIKKFRKNNRITKSRRLQRKNKPKLQRFKSRNKRIIRYF